jgi:hypothetical protein
MKFSMLRTTIALLLAGALLATLIPATSNAIVPPRNCGIKEVKGKRWQVKVDQVRCRTAWRYARSYIRGDGMPSAYRCRRGPRGSSLYAQCTATRYNPDRVIYIIRKSG